MVPVSIDPDPFQFYSRSSSSRQIIRGFSVSSFQFYSRSSQGSTAGFIRFGVVAFQFYSRSSHNIGASSNAGESIFQFYSRSSTIWACVSEQPWVYFDQLVSFNSIVDLRQAKSRKELVRELVSFNSIVDLLDLDERLEQLLQEAYFQFYSRSSNTYIAPDMDQYRLFISILQQIF